MSRINLPGWIAAAAALLVLWYLRNAVRYVLIVAVGSVLLAALVCPLVSRLEQRMKRMPAIISAWGFLLISIAALIALVVPSVLSYMDVVHEAWPALYARAMQWISANGDVKLPSDALAVIGNLSRMLMEKIGLIAGAGTAFGMMWILSIFLLNEREKYMLMAELLIPLSRRRAVLSVLRRILRELRLFIGGQLRVSAWVGALTCTGLWACRVPGALLLGMLTAIFNLIPYVGPYIAAVPVLLTALTDGWMRALMAGMVLFVVQQIDGFLISPRILSGATGLNPASVILALAAGGAAFGIAGMLLAIPAAITLRILYSEWAQNRKIDRDSARINQVFEDIDLR